MNRLAAICCIALLALSACGRPPGEAQVINVAGTATPNTPGEATWLQFKQAAEAAADGQVVLRTLIYGQLGSEEQLLSGLRRGRIQFANLSAQSVSTLVPELSLLYAPYLFDDEAEADFIYDNYLTGVFSELLAAQGLHLVTWYEIGFHSVYAREPVLVPADLVGRRFRVSSGINARLFAESLGADVIPLGFGDIVPSLQTGLIDAGENSISLYARTGIASEAPHFTLTRHVFGISVIVAGKRWWDAQPADLRKILRETFPSARDSRLATRAQDARDLADPVLGIVSHVLNPQQRAAWKQTTSGVTPLLLESIGGRSAEIHALILEGKQAYLDQARQTDAN